MEPVGKVLATMIKNSKKSWWQVEYVGGKVLSEWNTLTGLLFSPLGNSSSSKWEEIPKKDLTTLRLLCPNGEAAELKTTGTYCLFQLKSGILSVGIGTPASRACHYHIIGCINDTNGNCDCYAWDYREQKLLKFKDNVLHMGFDSIGPLSLGEAVGIK